MEQEPSSRSDAGWVLAVGIACIALIAGIIGVGLGVRAVDEAKHPGGSTSVSTTASVTLKEFSITPSAITVAQGGSLLVKNDGSVAHNLTVEGKSLATKDLGPGTSATLDVSSLPAGTYNVLCSISGHAASGMKGTLTIAAGGGAAASGTTATTAAAQDPALVAGSGTQSADQIDSAAQARTKGFPAATKGVGAANLDPKILPDGTKEFDLTADVIDWEVEPGKTVKAWGYNGMTPGPTLHVKNGDKVRLVLKNNLPESTTLHLHGLDIPNDMDGVPDVTQPQIKPGATYTYDFTAIGPAVGMYHAHSDSQKQVPMGLMAGVIITDMPIPAGTGPVTQEIPMVLNDAGSVGFSINGKSFPATAPIVVNEGDWIMVHYFNEGLQIHPMHLHGPKQLVIAKDGNPLASPYLADTVLVAPGERYTVLVHATRKGTWVWHCHILTHAESEAGFVGMTTALVVK